jgi:hypothetical protein
MAHKCFISFKMEDKEYKRIIQEDLDIDMIDNSLDISIDSDDEEHIMRKIREKYLSDSTVTIHLIGVHSAENLGKDEQRYIKRELQASLYHGAWNTQNGILGVVLPNMYYEIFGSSYRCSTCGNTHSIVNINDSTVIKEFSYNYYIPKTEGCGWAEYDRFCVLVKWSDFTGNPEKFIDLAFEKRNHPIAEKTKVRP